MDIILMGGLWLGSSAWDRVSDELRQLGHDPVPLSLPGTDDRSATSTLDDQVAAAVAAVDAADRPLVVGHSAACSLAWSVADRRPDAISGVVMIGGFPVADGEEYAPFFDIVDGVMPFPGWEPFEGPDSDDIDEELRASMAADAIPVPEGVAKGIVRLGDPRRFEVPVHIVCSEFSPDDFNDWLESGAIPELEQARTLRIWDIDSGHWPMHTRPVELARMLHAITQG